MTRRKESPNQTVGASSNTLPRALIETDTTEVLQHVQQCISPEHLEELAQSAISEDHAIAHGVYTAYKIEDLPEDKRWVVEVSGEKVLPALVYPLTEPDGTEKSQIKPQPGTVINAKGKPVKYVSGKGNASVELPCIRQVADPKGVVIVEGTKQSLAAAAYLPADWSIYMIAGINSWSRDGMATSYLHVVKGLPVVIIPDADAASNLNVYNGAAELGKWCSSNGAKSVAFGRLDTGGKAGLDDVLGRLDESVREDFAANLLATAKTKPADRKPDPREVERRKNKALLAKSDLPTILVDDQARDVTEACVEALHNGYPNDLFSHNNGLAELVDTPNGLEIRRLDEHGIHDLIARSADLVDKRLQPKLLPKTVLKAVERCHAEFPALTGVAKSPVVGEGGVMVTNNGFDETTGMYLQLSSDLEGLVVPEHPSDKDIAAARELIGELLWDFPFYEPSDRAHAVAGMLTPILRPLLPTVPATVITAPDSATGKGLLADCFSHVVFGQAPSLADLPESEAEIRKHFTASIAAGQTTKFLDEPSMLDSKNLNRIITAVNIEDRILGSSTIISVPNRMTIYALGNNMQISADTARRVVQVRLVSSGPNPETRSNFRHSLPSWAVENRRELLAALLTLIKAWFDRGQPVAPKPFDLGSFEEYQRVVGGILHVAGIPGFLEGLKEQRQEFNYSGDLWTRHYEWLYKTYGDKPFVSSSVAKEILADVNAEHVCLPPDFPDSDRGSVVSRNLSLFWSRKVQGGGNGKRSEGTWHGNLRLVKTGKKPGNAVQWVMECHGEAPVAEEPKVASIVPDRPAPVIEDLDSGWKTA